MGENLILLYLTDIKFSAVIDFIFKADWSSLFSVIFMLILEQKYRFDLYKMYARQRELYAEFAQKISYKTTSKIEKTVGVTKGPKESKRVSRKECKTCRQKQIRKQTVYECKTCPGQPGLCLDCFEDYHKNV